MNCDRCRSLASEALDGALTDPLLTGFREHVDACPACRSFQAELRDSLALLTELPEITVGDRFDDAVWAAIRSSERVAAPGWRSRLALPEGFRIADLFAWRWAPAMAVGTLALALALSLGPNSDRSDYARASDSGAAGFAKSLAGFDQDPLEGGNGWETPEVSVEAPMPVSVRLSQQQTGSDLRLRAESSPRRSSFTYTYPVRRVDVSGFQQVSAPTGQTRSRPVSADPRPAVIAF